MLNFTELKIDSIQLGETSLPGIRQGHRNYQSTIRWLRGKREGNYQTWVVEKGR